jgi:hypothetical protein
MMIELLRALLDDSVTPQQMDELMALPEREATAVLHAAVYHKREAIQTGAAGKLCVRLASYMMGEFTLRNAGDKPTDEWQAVTALSAKLRAQL